MPFDFSQRREIAMGFLERANFKSAAAPPGIAGSVAITSDYATVPVS